ncbi:MAG: carbon storage regulator [Gammaproteobacteria bacterium]|nr:carbon storage regulator [Gammaproteobacteria bacterium]
MNTIIVDLKESISITENIKLTLTAIKGNVTSLGIDAPRNVHILRTELKIDESLKNQHINRN